MTISEYRQLKIGESMVDNCGNIHQIEQIEKTSKWIITFWNTSNKNNTVQQDMVKAYLDNNFKFYLYVEDMKKLKLKVKL